MPNAKQDNDIATHDRYEEVLLCAPDGNKPVGIVRTIKWMETVIVTEKDEKGQEAQKPAGFLVTVPPRNALRIYSHICREHARHAEALAILEKDMVAKDRMPGKLPAVWNGAYTACPLCVLAGNKETK